MKKLVNIDSPAILYVLTPPLKGVINKIEMDVKNIRYCITKGAKVEEVLKDGSVVRLDLDNYDRELDSQVIETKNKEVEVKVEETVVEVTPPEPLEEVVILEEVTEEETIEEVKDTKQYSKGNKNESKKKY